MITIKVTTPTPKIPLVRQTPGKRGMWGNCTFIIDQPIERADWWFVLGGLKTEDCTVVPRERVVLVTHESIDMKSYDQKFIDQFGIIITSQREIKHPQVLHVPQGLPWMIGHMGSHSGVDPKDYEKYFTPYDALKNISSFKKERLLSVFSSGKNRTPGQKIRLEFIERLKKHFGKRIDVFGVNETFVKDKWDGIAPYQYHITLENSSRDDYWTEKLSDAFLGGAYPLYWGAPNIYKYFPRNSLTEINLNDFDAAIMAIEAAIAKNLYEKNKEEIMNARNLVLDKYNIFATMASLAEQSTAPQNPTTVTIKPEIQKKTAPQRIARLLRPLPFAYTFARKIFRHSRKQK